MKLRTAKGTAIVAVSIFTFLWQPGIALAVTCADFDSQADAQDFLRGDPTDPDGLDADGDGIACETNPAPYDRDPVERPDDEDGSSPQPAERHPYLGPIPPPLSALQGGNPPPLASLQGGSLQAPGTIQPPNTGDGGLSD